MADATYAIPGFLGGEISKFAQGRFDRPDYRNSLNVCLNAFPVDIGTWTRRPGTVYAGHTRAGADGRNIKFDFESADAVTMEFTDGFLRFRSGATLLGTNDDQTVVSVSAANPAVVTVATAVDWATGNTVMFPGASTPLLENRQFVATRIDPTHFSLADALTGAAIDGATLGALAVGASVMRVQEVATVYVNSSWADVRAVQAETTDILLSPLYRPQAMTVSTLPDVAIEAQFDITPAIFNDGPYLDPFTNGVRATPSAASGLITLTLSFDPYSATKAYAKDAFVTYASVDYISLIDQNVGNTPSTSPTAWSPTTASAAINDGQGFLGSDTGRLVRLLSEPVYWDAATPYALNAVVAYNPSGIPGATTYWQAQGATTGTRPGSELVLWKQVPQGAAIWSWGRITGLSNIIARDLVGSVPIGDMTAFNGITAPFDGVFTKPVIQTAGKAVVGGTVSAGTPLAISGFVGKNFSASSQRIKQATVYPSSNLGFGFSEFVSFTGPTYAGFGFFTLNLRAKATVPTGVGDGVLLGTVSFSGASGSAITIPSNDQATAWNYVWVEVIMSTSAPAASSGYSLTVDIAQISFFSPTSTTSSSAGCTVEILGPTMPYTNAILTWRLGAYSDTTGWPTCGCYYEGRIWLGGAIPNRFDASESNGIHGASLNFAPTDQYGVVSAANGISYELNSDSVNSIYWMQPDLQGIIMGTIGGEYLIVAPTNGPIAPTNISGRRITKVGSANVEPRRTEHTNIFVQRYRQRLTEYFPDAYSGKFTGPDLADRAQHIVAPSIAELAYCCAIAPILWGRCDDGSLFGVTYKRDTLTTSQGPTYAAFHRHTLGSGRTVSSVCSGPSFGGNLDTLTLVTTEGDGSIRHVEVLTDAPDETALLSQSWFLDDAVTPTSTSIDGTITADAPFGSLVCNGLWHLNGKTVQVFAGGLDCGDRGTAGGGVGYFTDFVVTNGSVSIPFGDGVDAGCGRGLFTDAFVAANPQIVIGFTYNSDGQMVRPIAPADTGARNGPALGKTRRNHQYSALICNSVGVSFGSDFNHLYPALFRDAAGNAIADLTTFTGVHHDTLQDDYSYDGMVAWRVSRPWPCNISAISGNIQTQDR